VSLSALRIIADVSDPQKLRILDSFFSQRPANQGLYFRGDKNLVEFFPVIANTGSSSPAWLPATVAAADLQLGIGDADLASAGGTAALNYDSNGTGLTAIAYNVSAGTLQTALNANAAVIATGQTVAVTLLATGIYKIAWSGVGVKVLIQGDAALLTPESVCSADWSQEGTASLKAIQLLRFLQRPFVFVDSWTALSGATATVTTLRVGSLSAKAMFSVSISPLPYAGSFAIGNSGAMAFNGTETDWQTALGTGWTALKTGDAQLTIERTTAAVYALVSGDVDVTGLSVYSGFRGTMNFNITALFERFATETGADFETSLHLLNDDGTNIDTLNYSPVTLHRSLLSSGSASPSNWNNGFYTKVQADVLLAALASFLAATVSTAGDTALAKSNAVNKTQTLRLTVSAGAGAYARTVSLSVTNCAAGDVARVTLLMPASVNPLIQIRNATSGGTLLYSMAGTGTALSQSLQFTYNGTAWESDQ